MGSGRTNSSTHRGLDYRRTLFANVESAQIATVRGCSAKDCIQGNDR